MKKISNEFTLKPLTSVHFRNNNKKKFQVDKNALKWLFPFYIIFFRKKGKI